MTEALFPRSFRKDYAQAVRGGGCYLYTSNGKKLLDAAGGAAVVTIGHGVKEIAKAMAKQAESLAYVHSSQFVTSAAETLAEQLLALAPPNFRRGGRVYFTSGGSEATETALKLSRQYFLERGATKRTRIVSRKQSYHGSTLGALSVSGNVRRRAPYTPMLHEWGHIPACYCYRCPLSLKYPSCNVACADELEKILRISGAETVAAFIFEPVVGATLGAVAPPDGYPQRIAEICKRHGILLIADEVMTGMGRTGKVFACEHWGIEPDIILIGKGVASGYAPLGAVLVNRQIVDTIAKGSGVFLHGFTFNAHPVATAAGLAVLQKIEKEQLFSRVAPMGRALMEALAALKRFDVVGDVRGLGLLIGIELVRDKATRLPFPRAAGIAGRVAQAAMDAGVVTYPIQGCVDGDVGDHILIAPPFILGEKEIQLIVGALETAIQKLGE